MRLREQVRLEEPFCRSCLAAGKRVATDEVDHIVPLSAGGGNERENLQGLCEPCHSAKSRAEAVAGTGRNRSVHGR